MITAFYSFKGGVGRTLAVVHVARRLARALAREDAGDVLVVDLDLEAPGLDPYLGGGADAACGGLARLLADLARRPEGAREAWLREALRDRRYVVPHPSLPLRYMPSGLGDVRVAGASYSTVAAALRAIIDEPDGASLAALRDALAASATYVILDSRTGLADESYLSTVLLPDALVLLFRPSRLHLDGVEQVYRNFLARKDLEPGDPRAPVIPVVSPLPNRGGTDITTFLTKEVSRVFRWRWPNAPGVEQRLDAPLERHGARRLVRLYAEPAVDLGETALVDEQGDWRPGFDTDTPLPQGYARLVDRLRALNFRADWRAADRLARHWATEGEDTLAALFLVQRIRQRWGGDDALMDYPMEEPVLLSVLGPALEDLPGTDVAAALSQVGAILAANAEVEGDALVRAVGWAGAAPTEDAAHLSVYALASRFQPMVEAALRGPLGRAVEDLATALDEAEGTDTASRAGLASLFWGVGAAEASADQLVRISASVFHAAEPEVGEALWRGALPGWGLGAVPFVARLNAAVVGADHAEILATLGWPSWAYATAAGADLDLLDARGTDAPAPEAAPEPRPGGWFSTVLRGGVPSSIPSGARQTEPALLLAALREAAAPDPSRRTFELFLPVPDRNVLGWQFARAWVRDSLETGPVAPPNIQQPLPLSVALFDTFRMGLYAAIREDADTVDVAVALLEETLAVAPGLGVVARRMDGIRAPLLAAFHLARAGRLSESTRALLARLRAPLDADVPLPEPPLDDLAAGYALQPDLLRRAARLATELPERILALQEWVKRMYGHVPEPR